MADLKTSFNGKKSYEFLEHLAVKIGPRLTASAGEHKAAHYIEKQFKSFGLKTTLQKFPAMTFENKKTTFEVKEKGKWRSMRCEPIMLTKATPARGVEADLFFLESGDPERFTAEMKDKIVLICGGIAPANRPLFLSYKPKALIMIAGGVGRELTRYNMRPDSRKEFGALPMAQLLHLDGLDIVKKGLTRGRLTMNITEKKSHGFNVIGEKTGSEFPDEIAVICGHYDSSMGISGAADNAGGTAVMMELARIFASQPTKRTLRFIAFGGEETGLHGSTFYANELARKAKLEKKKKSFNDKVDKTECEKHRLTFNLDIHGFIIGSNSSMFNGPDDIGASVRLLGRETGMFCGSSKGPMSSDGTPLAAVGIPNVQFARNGGSGEIHTPYDDIANLSAEGLAKGGRFAELYLRRYVTECTTFPFAREIPEDQMKGVREYFTNGKNPVPGDKYKEDEDKDKARKTKPARKSKKTGKKAAKKK